MKKKGYIYKIVINNLIYVGSCVDLQGRKITHNFRLKDNERNHKLYQKCRENNINKIELILIEEYDYNDIIELRQKEQHYINELKANLNEKRAYWGTGTIKEKQRQDRIDNPEKYKQYDKNKYEKNKEKILEKAKIYRDINKDKIKENKKEYYKKNKEKKLERAKEKKECDICGCLSTIGHIARHQKTKKCMSHIKK